MLAHCLAIAFALTLCGGCAQAQSTAASVVDVPGQPQAMPPTVSTAHLGRDTRRRPTVAVRLNGQGPFAMVLDTAAQTSLVSQRLAEQLHLPALGGGMSVNGVGGEGQARLYGVDEFETDLFRVESRALVVLTNAGVTDADGIVGMEMFTDGRLTFDHAAGVVSLSPSGEAPPGYVAVQGRLDDAGLLTVPIEIDGVVFDALVDTGAAVTIASRGALRALGWSADDPRLQSAGTIIGANNVETPVRTGRIARMKIGPADIQDLDLIFSDSDMADTGAVPNRPELILGSDILGAFDAFALDFPRAQLQIRVPDPE